MKQRGSFAAVYAAITIALLLCVSCRSVSQVPRPMLDVIQAREQFHVVDILFYKDKPAAAGLGMIPGLGTGAFWGTARAKDTLDETGVRREIEKWKDFGGLFYVDIEVWPTCYVADSIAERSIARFSRVVDLVREVAPHLTFGIYGEIPATGYWPIVSGDSARYREWTKCNQRMARLAKKVDVIFPSLYTYYDDEAGWDKYAIATMEAARQYGKPVYPFLWPEYHESHPRLAGVNIPGRVWRHELEVVRAHADGVVLWNGLKRPWDDRAGWWNETRAFLSTIPAKRPTH